MDMLVTVVDAAFDIYKLLIFARIVVSWIRIDPYNPIVKFIYEMTEPVMGPFRRIIPPIGMIDISPIVLFLVLNLLHGWVIKLLVTL